MAEIAIENDEPSDQVGCVRNFTLKDGNHIREQLLALSDNDYISTYCILDATLPMQRYVATVQLKRVTDRDRTFWHWQSTFDTPRGREQEFADLVGKGVYEGGFEGLRAFLRRRPGAPAIGSALGLLRRNEHAGWCEPLRGSDCSKRVAQHSAAAGPARSASACRDRVITSTYIAQGRLR